MNRADIANGRHYKGYVIQQSDVGQPLDPMFIDDRIGLSGSQMLIVKKGWRMGKGDKDKRQDLEDIIGACKRMLELMDADIAEAESRGDPLKKFNEYAIAEVMHDIHNRD